MFDDKVDVHSFSYRHLKLGKLTLPLSFVALVKFSKLLGSMNHSCQDKWTLGLSSP